MGKRSQRQRRQPVQPPAGPTPSTIIRSEQGAVEVATPTVFGLPLARIIEIALVAVAIPLLSYLAIKITSLDTTVASANLPDLVKGMTSTKERVDVLYQALPRMRIQIAEERTNAPVHVAVVATQPNPDDHTALVHVVDFDHQTKKTYVVPASVATSPDYALKVRGAAASLDDKAASFASCQIFLDDIKKDRVTFPASVNQELSFAIMEQPSAAEVSRTTSALALSLGTNAQTERFITRPAPFQGMAMEVSRIPTISSGTVH